MSKEQYITSEGNITTGHTHSGGSYDVTALFYRTDSRWDRVCIKMTFEDEDGNRHFEMKTMLTDEGVAALIEWLQMGEEEDVSRLNETE